MLIVIVLGMAAVWLWADCQVISFLLDTIEKKNKKDICLAVFLFLGIVFLLMISGALIVSLAKAGLLI